MTTQKILSTSVVLFAVSASILLATSQAQAAAACEITVDATDAMAFSTKSIDVSKTCKEFTINLKHVGKLPKNVMGHNLVISKEADKAGVLADGSKAGLPSDYVKASDARVIAATTIIGGGETASTKFAVSKLNAKDAFEFYCSFPGHAFMMKGVVKLV
ncbi:MULTISPECIES: azurin [Methylotenera]|uniref:azurin n=1 Tax=Methylotenera TaxID=359407 RepID=UPI000375AC2F|nr:MULTISPECIES: azurin [Methylotenera]